MKHNAIYALYPNVVTIDDSIGALDKDGNLVDVDLELVNAWVDPEQYKYQRQQAYPSIADQLDALYHKGYDGWKAEIEAIKNRFPKGAA